jgi:hypothetical protein
LIHSHDDWSCLEDMVAAGLVEAGFKGNPYTPFGGTVAAVQFTEAGWAIAGQLRKHRGVGGRYSEFSVAPCPVMLEADLDTFLEVGS